MLTVIERSIGGVSILDLDGSIRLGESESQLREAVKNLTSAGRTKLLLNMEKVDYMDSSGLGALVYSFTSMQRKGGQLKLVKVGDRVRDILDLTRLSSVFEVFKDEGEAVKSFG